MNFRLSAGFQSAWSSGQVLLLAAASCQDGSKLRFPNKMDGLTESSGLDVGRAEFNERVKVGLK